MQPRNPRTLAVIAGVVIVLLLIGRSILRSRHESQLLQDMQSKDKATRVAAAEELLRDDRLVDFVLAQPMVIVDHKDQFGIRHVDKTDASVRTAAVDATYEASEDAGYRERAIKALIGLMKGVDREATDQSKKVRDAEKAVRDHTRDQLGNIGVPAIDDLIFALKDPSGMVRDGAAGALARIGVPAIPKLVASLRDRDREGEAESALSGIGKPALNAVIPLIDITDPKEEDFPVSMAAFLGGFGDPRAVEPLLAHIDDTTPGMRRQVIHSLTGIQDQRATPAILRVMKQDPYVRLECISCVSASQDPRAVNPLVDLFKDNDSDVPKAAVSALQRIGKPSLPRLLKEAKNPDPVIRMYATRGLAFVGGPETVAPLLAAAQPSEKDPTVRREGVLGLGRLTGADALRAVPVLIARFHDTGDIATAATASLKEIAGSIPDTDTAALEAITKPLVDVLRRGNKDYTAVYYAENILASLNQRAAPVLIAALKDPSPTVRKWSALALGDMEDHAAVQSAVPLLQQMAKTDQPEVAYAATTTLQKMGEASTTTPGA